MNNDNKPWYEKLQIWISIIIGIGTIIGTIVGYLGCTESQPNPTPIFKNNITNTETPKINTDQPSPTLTTETPIETTDQPIINEESEEVSDDQKILLSEKHTPDDPATNVYISEWDSDMDIGIDGKMYGGGHKITISNTFNALGSNLDNKVKSRIIIPLSDEVKQNDETHRFTGTFVLDKDMFGSHSSGTIKILIDNKKVFSTGKIGGKTTKAFPFDVNYGDADSIIIQTNVTLNGGDFVYGFVSSKD